MYLCEDDPVNVLHMDTDTSVSLKCANRTDRTVDVLKLSCEKKSKYATLLPGGSLKVKGYFPEPMVFRDAETKDIMWVKRRYVRGVMPDTGELCYHFIVYVTRGVVSLKELALKRILPFIKERRDVRSLELPQTLEKSLQQMVDRRRHFFNFFALKFETITTVPLTKNCFFHEKKDDEKSPPTLRF